MTIGILSAMSKEHEQLTHLLANPIKETDGGYSFTKGTLGQNTLILMQCGIGKVNAAVGATTLIRRYKPDCLISTGCAGGIDERLRVMDVVVSTATVYHDVIIPGCDDGQIQGLPARFKSEDQLVETAMEHLPQPYADNHQPSVYAGLICTGDQFISEAAQLAAIKSKFPEALAVDMESAAVAQTCFLHGLPFVSFRVLSDTPGTHGNIQQYQDFWSLLAERSFSITRRFLAALPTQFSLLDFKD